MKPFVKLKKDVTKLSVASNIILVLLKLAVGLYCGAISIVSEALHSIMDFVASTIAYLAVRQAAKPPDNNHAYGYGKLENLSGVIESFFMILAALWIVREAVEKFHSPHAPEYIEYGIGIMLLSMMINWYVSKKLLAAAEKTNSQALEADALHQRADVWTSLGVLVGLVMTKMTALYWLDSAMALVVAAIIFKAGYRMITKSILDLTDGSLPPEDEEIIRQILNSHPEIFSFRRLRTRRSGSHRLIDVSILITKNMCLDEAHAICDEIEAQIAARFAPCDTVIHLEPHPSIPYEYDISESIRCG